MAAGSATRIVRALRKTYFFVVWAFLFSILVQVFFAGLSLFAGEAWATHAGFGYTIGFLPLILLVLAFPARLPRGMIGWTALLFGLYILQTFLPPLRNYAPVVAAFHPVNAFLLFSITAILAWRSRPYMPAPLGTGTAIGAAPAEPTRR